MIILFPKNVWYRKLLSYIFRWAIRQIINYIFLSQVIEYLTQVKLKGTPGYDKLNFIDCQWLVKTNGATFIFIGKLGKKSGLRAMPEGTEREAKERQGQTGEAKISYLISLWR